MGKFQCLLLVTQRKKKKKVLTFENPVRFFKGRGKINGFESKIFLMGKKKHGKEA